MNETANLYFWKLWSSAHGAMQIAQTDGGFPQVASHFRDQLVRLLLGGDGWRNYVRNN